MSTKDFRDLKVWEKAHQLAIEAYRATSSFPKEEVFGLTSQIRRSGASIPTNIAEGRGRGSDPELARFLRIAMGSASELEYEFLLAHDLGFMADTSYEQLAGNVIEIKRMLTSLIKKLRAEG